MARRARLHLAGLLAAAMGCGQGLYDARWYGRSDGGSAVLDGGATDHVGDDVGDDDAGAGPPDAGLPDRAPDVGPSSACQQMDYNSGSVALGEEARLFVPENALRMATRVCLVRTSPAERRAPLGRSYEIRLSDGASRFTEPPRLDLYDVVPPAGTPFERMSVAYLLREGATDMFYWIPIQDGRTHSGTTITGRVHTLTQDGRGVVALVVQCERIDQCPNAQESTCRSAACQ